MDRKLFAQDGHHKKADDTLHVVDSTDLESPTHGGCDEIRPSVYHNPDCYFSDGVRQIDFLLVYEEETWCEGGGKREAENKRQTAQRNKFLKNLDRAGVQMEEEMLESGKTILTFLKLHVPWELCCAVAEDLALRAPLQAHPNPSDNFTGKWLRRLHIPNLLDQDVPNKPLDFYTCQFKTSKLRRFLGSEDQENFFPAVQRHRIVHHLLSATVYGKRKRAEIGIERLLEDGVFTAAYPLHDGPYEKPSHLLMAPEDLNPRQVLYEYWARWGCWHKYQPLDHIREYFGEKIGIYFAWLGFYTAWLLPASVLGVLVFLYGVFTMDRNVPAQEVCGSGQRYLMCPLSDQGDTWHLSDVCVYVKVAYLFDHPGTVLYSVFVSFWAVTFLEYWKRKNASLAHHWDCLDQEEEEERPRPEYAARAGQLKENPVTGIREPFFDPRDRIPRVLSGIAAIVIMVCLVLIFIVAVIIYRAVMTVVLFDNRDLRSRASLISSLSAALVNLLLILVLGRVYERLALRLTQWEMHRTQQEFEDQLTFKVFIFQFINFYSSIIYIAFFKGRFAGYPGHYNRFLGLRSEECSNGGCLIELAQQLAVIMIGKQVINNAQEILVPKLKGFWHRLKVRKVRQVSSSPWEKDFELIENEGLFQEYLEMVLQFGFITLFVAAFPLAPLFAVLNNWVEIRLDARKLVCETRRPVAHPARDIGVWFTILHAMAHLAVISNAFLIAFTSEFLPRQLYQYQFSGTLEGYVNFTLAYAPANASELTQECRYRDFRDPDGQPSIFYWHLLALRLAFVIVFEHAVFGVCRLIDILVPDVPEQLEIKIKRERYLAKQALADTAATLMTAEEDPEESQNTSERGMFLEVPRV
ncbi:anoctamin-7-like [Babylonia areolata]|uniref:anoctamin-7-like n=1 Tax=Babylonia areolata TaxID=304850 RepID=UPI003FD6AB06